MFSYNGYTLSLLAITSYSLIIKLQNNVKQGLNRAGLDSAGLDRSGLNRGRIALSTRLA